MVLDLLTQFIRNAPVIAFIKDLDGRYRHVSGEWLLAFQTTEDQVLGKNDHDLFSKEQADNFVKNDREVLETCQASRRFEEVLVPPEVRTFFSTKFVLVDEHGLRTGVAGFAVDVTEQQRVMQELDRQKRFLERTQTMASVGGWEFDVSSARAVWTSETFRMLELDERLGAPSFKTMLLLIVPEHREQLLTAHTEALSSGEPFHLEVTVVTHTGRRVRLRLNGVPQLIDGKVTRLSGAVQDVTAERLVEERLRHSNRMDAVGQLAGGVAHDFNNMLGAIVSASELLRLEPLSLDANDAVSTILTAATQAAGLTRQLLLFSRKESSRRTPTDLHVVLTDALTILQRTLGSRIQVVVQRMATHTAMRADGPQLSNALINLAINARDAMPEGGTLTFRTVDDAPGFIRLEVVDTGMGMGPEVLSHIFDPFFTTKERGRGTGLGLATVDAAVRAHDGEIIVQSTPGEGTTFQLRLPLIAGVIESRPAAKDVVKPQGGELLLIVDDELLVRQALVPLLKRLGYRVVEARSGAEAIETLATVKPALMILDLVMPGLSAVDTFRTAREMIPGLPVLFCSGFAPEALISSLQSGPHTARLAKPFSTQELQTAVRALLS